MHKNKLSLNDYVAEQAIKFHFKDTKEKIMQRQNSIELCSVGKINKEVYYRLQKLEINRMLTDAVIDSLNKQELLLLEYR